MFRKLPASEAGFTENGSWPHAVPTLAVACASHSAYSSARRS